MTLRTFSIQTLGCRVNHYESEQMAAVLRRWGLREVGTRDGADVRIVHTCSVTTEAAGKSRQSVRRATRLPVLQTAQGDLATVVDVQQEGNGTAGEQARRARVVVTGCWATSDGPAASAIPGVDAVLGHDADVAGELDRLLAEWVAGAGNHETAVDRSAGLGQMRRASSGDNGWNDQPDAKPDGANATRTNEPLIGISVKKKSDKIFAAGTTLLPLLGERQGGHQRAFLKIQDGCDAHCTYCIIPQLRPRLWSKPVEETVEEARRLVAAGHGEVVLTGIFIGAYGQPTALRRRQPFGTAEPLAELLVALCERVEGLKRLRVSSMEPGDLTDELIDVMRGLKQVVPHFHLPLQSGSDAMLRRMNRQYTRADFLRMVECVNAAFDRPALTTDIIVGFPGESDEDFRHTTEVVDAAGFIHVHAFSYSPRPNTAAARWQREFIPAPVGSERIKSLREMANRHSYEYRKRFLGQTVEILVEHPSVADDDFGSLTAGVRHGRCERYFPVFVDEGPGVATGQAVRVRIDRVTAERTWGSLV